jgi:hypothetical protein
VQTSMSMYLQANSKVGAVWRLQACENEHFDVFEFASRCRPACRCTCKPEPCAPHPSKISAQIEDYCFAHCSCQNQETMSIIRVAL